MPTTAAPICRIDLQHMQICTTSAAWSALDLIMPRTRELRSAIHPDDRDEFASFLNNAPHVPAQQPARTIVRMHSPSGWRATKVAALRLEGLTHPTEIMIRLS